MSNQPSDRASRSRAEARRRARLAARGVPQPGDEALDEQPRSAARSGGFLTRIFPPAPPLPNRPPPLAGFTYAGPARDLVAIPWLLGRMPLVWILGGLAWLGGYLTSFTEAASGPLGLVGTMVQFLGLIAAGWFGWRRPWLYGTASAVLGVALLLVVTLFVQRNEPAPTGATPGSLALGIVFNVVYAALFGALAGWYGGYLRRRQSAVAVEARRTRRPRR